jgi:hypothetical protein
VQAFTCRDSGKPQKSSVKMASLNQNLNLGPPNYKPSLFTPSTTMFVSHTQLKTFYIIRKYIISRQYTSIWLNDDLQLFTVK